MCEKFEISLENKILFKARKIFNDYDFNERFFIFDFNKRLKNENRG